MIQITIGDWSLDGHGWNESFFVEGASIDEVKSAYLSAVDLTGIDFYGVKRGTIVPFCDFEENTLSMDARDRLGEFGIETKPHAYGPGEALSLLLDFIRIGGVSLSPVQMPTLGFRVNRGGRTCILYGYGYGVTGQ